MARIEWQRAFNTDIYQVDEQHKKLVAMINRLDESLRKGMGIVNQEEGPVLVALVDYTKYHFDTEEKVMQKIGYPHYQKHKGLHEDLRRKIVSMLLRLKDGGSVSATELMSFLTDWLLDHIIQEDKKIGVAYTSADSASMQA